MKNIFLFIATCFIFIISIPLNAQVGLSGHYKSMTASGWEDIIATYNVENSNNMVPLKNGYSISLDYWFRLKNKRVEFLPEVNYSAFSNDNNSLSTNFYSFFANVNLYFLDFDGDCDCPTFGKEGPSLKKGLHFQISPGLSYIQKSVNLFALSQSQSGLAFNVGVGLGYDMGFSDFFTLTPIVKYYFYPGHNWPDFDVTLNGRAFNGEPGNTTPLTHFTAGVRLGFRFDKLGRRW